MQMFFAGRAVSIVKVSKFGASEPRALFAKKVRVVSFLASPSLRHDIMSSWKHLYLNSS